jgi:TPR repeat protein
MALGRRAAMGMAWRTTVTAGSSVTVSVASVPKMWRQHDAGHTDAAAKPSNRQAEAGSVLLWAERLVSPAVLGAARSLLQRAEFDRDADTVDGSPTFELLWARKGEYVHAELADVFRSTVETKLLPVLRGEPSLYAHGDAQELVLCEALVRVYADGLRRVHPAHYDTDALVTAVFEIDLGGQPFQGPGFYVQPGAHVSSRIAVPLAPGDVLAHSFDLQHGVEVTSGRRCSVIMWFADSKAACRDKSRSWCRQAAETGNADAQYVLAGHLDNLSVGADEAQAQVLSLLRAAARQGHFGSQNYLGHVLLHSVMGATHDQRHERTAEAVNWFEASAAQGFHKAMVSLARHHTTKGDVVSGIRWLQMAAEQRADPAVLHELWVLLCSEEARPYLHDNQHQIEGRGYKWLQMAAEMGYPASQLAMGRLLLETPGRTTEAEAWLLKASNHGVIEASVALATGHMWAGRLVDAVRILWTVLKRRSRPSSKQQANAHANAKSWLKVDLMSP